jgi:predicted glycosyltransferase
VTYSRPKALRVILLYSQDRRGLGHINRTLTIARHLLAADPNLVAYVATKSAISGNFTLPERCDYIKLPTRLTPRRIQRTAEDEQASNQHFRKLRAQILQDAALMLAPDLVLVDHEPMGSSGEFRDGLYALKAQYPGTRFVFGLRDIMDDEVRIRAQWKEMGVYDALENLYDGIAVYGLTKLYDVAEAYALPLSVRPKLHYCGYMVRDLAPIDSSALRQQHGLPPNGRLVLATVGSGYDGYPVLEATGQAMERLQARFPDLTAIMVTGPLMPSAQQAALLARSNGCCRVVSRADTYQLMALADAVVSMGGYNGVCEALSLARPLVIVPRATHKIEQQIRAEMLAARGLARWVHPKESNGETLAAALEWALGSDRQAHAQRVRELIPSFDGAVRLTQYLSRWLGDS